MSFTWLMNTWVVKTPESSLKHGDFPVENGIHEIGGKPRFEEIIPRAWETIIQSTSVLIANIKTAPPLTPPTALGAGHHRELHVVGGQAPRPLLRRGGHRSEGPAERWRGPKPTSGSAPGFDERGVEGGGTQARGSLVKSGT